MSMIEDLNQAASKIDPHLIDCPTCGGTLRAEYKRVLRPVSEACEMFGLTVDQLREAGANINSFGYVDAAVPYVTCMHCGAQFDGSQEPVIES